MTNSVLQKVLSARFVKSITDEQVSYDDDARHPRHRNEKWATVGARHACILTLIVSQNCLAKGRGGIGEGPWVRSRRDGGWP